MPDSLRIVFMGTPDFAVPTLQALVEQGYAVVAVVTAPDKPSGRGLKLTPSPVKEYALSQQIPVLQPTNLKSEAFGEELRSYGADLQVIVAFRMLPEVVWRMPRLGSLNVHASLLPQYRGAAPINWALIHGEKETGVTTFFLQHQIDTGDLLLQKRVPVKEEDDFGTMFEKLKYAGAELALETVAAIAAGTVKPVPQTIPEEGLRHAPKIFKETCQIDWNQPAVTLRNFIRGLSPLPAAWTTLQDKVLKIYQADVLPAEETGGQPGEVLTDGKTYLRFRTGEGLLSVTDLQLEGKKRMPVGDFLRGFKFNE
ncbi:methionyl-tRNA formyltransferase [soil metagenome]